jgi:predicted dehydrogenase
MDELRVGIVGYGFMGRAHIYGYRTIPLYYTDLPFKIRLVGICDTVPGVAEKAKEQLGFDFATTNPEDIFNCKDIDLVDICTPNIYHKDGVLRALKAGKNVYCDKPLAASYEEAKEVLEALKSTTATTQMALQYRCYPATMRAKELIAGDRLGRIFSFRAAYLHASAVDPKKPIGWKQDKKFGGGGVLFDLGSHVIDLLHFLLGEYDSVMTETNVVYKERPDNAGNMVTVNADEIAFLMARMKNGAVGTIEASKMATGVQDEVRLEIHGEKGAISFNSMRPNELLFYDNTESECALGGDRGFTAIECVNRYPAPGGKFPGPKFPIGFMRAHVHSLFNFVMSVYQKKQGSPSFADGAYVQYVMEKAYEADEKKQWVKL